MGLLVLIVSLSLRCLLWMWLVVVEIGSGGVLLLCDGWKKVAGQQCKIDLVGSGEWAESWFLGLISV